MDALEFLKTAKRRYESNPDEHFSAIYFDMPDFEDYVKDVEKWAKEHPIKTRQTEFLKMFPNALMRFDGYLNVAPCVLDEEIYRKCSERSQMKCDKCYKDFWSKDVGQ